MSTELLAVGGCKLMEPLGDLWGPAETRHSLPTLIFLEGKEQQLVILNLFFALKLHFPVNGHLTWKCA